MLFKTSHWWSRTAEDGYQFAFIPTIEYYCWPSEMIEGCEEHTLVLKWMYINLGLSWYKPIEEENYEE